MTLQQYAQRLQKIHDDTPLSYLEMAAMMKMSVKTLMRIINGTNKKRIYPKTERKLKEYISLYDAKVERREWN